MVATANVMAESEDDERLNETDRAIIELLREGRENRGSLSEQLDKHPEYIGQRLKWLREWGYVRYHHEPTGLYELAE
jgi:DNA-binding IclR family transcriptional regulator